MQESAQGSPTRMELEADLKLCGAGRMSRISVLLISLEKYLPCLPSQTDLLLSLGFFLCPLLRFKFYTLASLLGWRYALLQ